MKKFILLILPLSFSIVVMSCNDRNALEKKPLSYEAMEALLKTDADFKELVAANIELQRLASATINDLSLAEASRLQVIGSKYSTFEEFNTRALDSEKELYKGLIPPKTPLADEHYHRILRKLDQSFDYKPSDLIGLVEALSRTVPPNARTAKNKEACLNACDTYAAGLFYKTWATYGLYLGHFAEGWARSVCYRGCGI